MPDDQCIKMFGCDKQAMAELPQQVYGTDIDRVLMLAVSILSDAQHVMAQGDVEMARQFINKSKHVIGLAMDACDTERQMEQTK